MVNRTVLLLACGPGSSEEYDQVDTDVAKPGGGGRLSLALKRSVWSACVEASLEYARVVYELQTQGAGVSAMVADASSEGSARVLNSWAEKEQSLSKMQSTLELVRPSSTPIDAEAAAAAAAQELLKGVDRGQQAGARRGGRRGCRVVFVATPAALGCEEGEAAAMEERIQRAARVVWTRLQPPSDLDVRLHMVWVAPEGAAGGRGGSAGVPPSQVKARMCRLVQTHLHLQCVRITGIPMKDGDKAKDGGKDGGKEGGGEGGKEPSAQGGKPKANREIYEVVLLCLAEQGDPAERMLEWQPLKALEKHININAYASRSIRRSTALDLSAKPTQTLVKHLRAKPATLIPALVATQAGGAPAGGPSPFPVANSKIPGRLIVLRDFMGAVFLHELLLCDAVNRVPPRMSLGEATNNIPVQVEASTSSAIEERFREMVRLSCLPLSKAELQAQQSASTRAYDADVREPVPHVTTTAIERRTRYLPLSEAASNLFANSTDKERSTRNASVNRPMVQGEVVVSRSGEMTAARKQPIRGLKEFVETCTQMQVAEQTVTVAVETVKRVHQMWQQAQTASVINGWGLHELRELWMEICKMGTACGKPPATASHYRITKILGLLGGLLEGHDAAQEGVEEGAGGAGALAGGKRRAQDAQPQKVAKPRKMIDLPLDDNGRPLMPMHLGPALTILNIGQVRSDNPNFHSDKHIWPVGYKCRRQYHSCVELDKKCDYICEILDGGTKPIFRITPSDAPHFQESGVTASGVWSAIMKKFNSLRLANGLQESKTAVSGPNYYGIDQPEVKRLIQELPGARECAVKPMGHGSYVWKDFADLGLPDSSAQGKGGAAVGEGGERKAPEGEEDAAFAAMDEMRGSLQMSGREGAGIDNPEERHALAQEREMFVDDGGLSVIQEHPKDSLFRVYWEAYVTEESRQPAQLDGYIDLSRITGR